MISNDYDEYEERHGKVCACLHIHTCASTAACIYIAVVIGDKIEFFTQNQTLTVTVDGAVSLTGIAYDDQTRKFYLSDSHSNISIFSNDLTETNFSSKPLLKAKQDETNIVATTFDTNSRTLFWIDALKRMIMKMHIPMDSPPEEPVILHNLTEIPRGIVLDTCNSHIYWSNSNRKNSTIERSNMDGTNRTIIIRGDLYVPTGLAIDYEEGKLYWTDDEEGIHVKIERSNLDGTEREKILKNRNQQPVYIAVDKDFIYWSDWVHKAIWMMAKNSTDHESPVKFKSYRKLNKDSDPNAIITRNNVGTIDCSAISKRRLEKEKLAEKKQKSSLLESYNNLTTSTEDVKTENSQLCLNGGSFDRIESSCRCKFGYTGSMCEISLCQNYCLQGDCIVNNFGKAECKCIGTFTGKRCERDICEGYCLHDGECSVQNNMPVCECKNSKGERCEILPDIPALNVDKSSCGLICAENNYTSEKMLTLNENCESKTLLFVLIALIIVLIILILVMSFYLHKLRRRPRIKKRFVVSKGGITPLTSRPQLTDNQCEITIENCCNMNICETPCFEPKLRTPVTKNNKTKKDEKNSLLDNMEGNSC
ncbi:protein cueball isoform X1 [Vespa velutina]|uniref:protein cueball isoform X1 n=1 Tax=Vespa velutina TaxID=202808 RepID=UPI001FB4DA02|nr:protein cueball isoform X1 [Vespa velutina]